MNTLDVLVLIVIAAAAAGGLRAGFVSRVVTWAGLAAGAWLATRTVPFALTLVGESEPLPRFVAAVAALVLTVGAVTSLAGVIGSGLRRGLHRTPLSVIDRVAGAVAGVGLVLAVVWFLLPAAADVPGGVARQVRSSTILTAVATVAPPPPEAARTLRSLVDASRFPEVLADLSSAPVEAAPPEQIGVPDEVVDRVTAATVRVTSGGCGQRFDGSGWAVGPDTVVTNAHVVAGADEVRVRRPDGSELAAVVTRFDPRRDLAVLAVDGLGQDALALGEAQPRSEAVAVGYPGGQPAPRAAAVHVERRRTALGRDIYGVEETEREVLFLATRLVQGDSGSPVVDASGDVIGVVFAISPENDTTAYALDRTELDAVLAAEPVTGATGRCLE